MRSPRYPLEPLVELRQKKVDEAVRELAGAARDRDSAAGARRAVEERRGAHERAIADVRAAEGEALARGELRVADLARAGAWSLRVGADGDALAAGVERARATEARARAAEATAQSAVGSRRAEAQVVTQHRARWGETRRKDLEAKDEEASSEAHGTSRGSAGHGRSMGRPKR